MKLKKKKKRCQLHQLFKSMIQVIRQEALYMKKTIVIKPEPARRVNLVAGPVRVCQKTGRCNDPAKPDRTSGSTHDPGDLGKPERDPIFFSNVVFLLYPSIFIFLSQLLTLFKAYYINIRKVFYFFNMGFETLQYIYSIFPRKKLCFFNVGFETL